METPSHLPQKGLTIDIIISRFIPIIGVLLFTIGLGYLIYTSVWISLGVMEKLGLGFFLSLVISVGAFSFSDKLRYFADVVMGGGILLFYGTLIYGSRTTDLAMSAPIPEVATLVTAFIFTVAVAYFASYRRSKVILSLGIIGAYLTPFVIGQNDSWVQNISFNAYLIYFAAVNGAIFFMGREMATHDLIPLNMFGLFFGTSTLYHLSYFSTVAAPDSILSGSLISAVLFVLLVGFCVGGIATSAGKFDSKDEILLSIGYLFPLAWLVINLERLTALPDITRSFCFFATAIIYFSVWHYVRGLSTTRTQHLPTYASAIIMLILALTTLFEKYTILSSIAIAYVSLIFGVLYIFQPAKWERLFAMMIFSGFGGVLSLYNIYFHDFTPQYPTFLALVSLLPATSVLLLAQMTGGIKPGIFSIVKVFSFSAGILMVGIFLQKMYHSVDTTFILFILPSLLIVLYARFSKILTLNTRGQLMRTGVLWGSIAAIGLFLHFMRQLVPHQADMAHFWVGGEIFSNWKFINAVLYTIILFLALRISRGIQAQTNEDRPSFLLVIFSYTFLLLLVNFSIITTINDLGTSTASIGGPRAIATTVWWTLLSLSMLSIGIHKGHWYRSEKLLGLLLLFLTVGKIVFYDLVSMDMQKKVLVLMIVGGFLMLFSYILQQKGYLKETHNS